MEERFIICIDDEMMVLTALSSQISNILKGKFYIETFENPLEAIDFLEELFTEGIEPELVFCDWLMPNMKGDEVLDKISKLFPDVPMVMLSGFAKDSAVQKSKNSISKFKFISKPWSKTDIENVLNEYIN